MPRRSPNLDLQVRHDVRCPLGSGVTGSWAGRTDPQPYPLAAPEPQDAASVSEATEPRVARSLRSVTPAAKRPPQARMFHSLLGSTVALATAGQ